MERFLIKRKASTSADDGGGDKAASSQKKVCVETTHGKKNSHVFSSSYKGIPLPHQFKCSDSSLLVHLGEKVAPSPKIAAFDFDGCLAKTSFFKRGPDAWSLYHPNVTDVLKQCIGRGYKLVVFTNEAPIGKAAKEATRAAAITQKLGRLRGFSLAVGLPMQVLVATGKDSFRKPGRGMWEFFQRHCNDGVSIDHQVSFFVGDAAGRKRDKSDSDRAFADAVRVRFFTEEIFSLDMDRLPLFIDADGEEEQKEEGVASTNVTTTIAGGEDGSDDDDA